MLLTSREMLTSGVWLTSEVVLEKCNVTGEPSLGEP